MQSNDVLTKEQDKGMVAFIDSELKNNQFDDFQDFEQQINSLFYSKVATISEFTKLKNKSMHEAKKFVLSITMEDLLNDYQRLTTSEAYKFDMKFGEMVNSASRALYSEMGSVAFEDGTCESQINFRNIDVDLIFNTSLDLFQFLDYRDQKF